VAIDGGGVTYPNTLPQVRRLVITVGPSGDFERAAVSDSGKRTGVPWWASVVMSLDSDHLSYPQLRFKTCSMEGGRDADGGHPAGVESSWT